MCYSAPSSFGTFIFVICISYILWIRGSKVQKSLSIILGVIALMQLVEGFLWLNIECDNTNVFISSFIPILLFIQPIVVIATIYTFGSGFLSPIVYKILLGISLISMPYYLDWFKDGVGKCTVVGSNGHLVWSFTNTNPYPFANILYNIILGVGIATLNTEWYGLFYLVMATLGYFKSKMTYGHSWASVWCHFVNLLSIGALFI